MAENPTNQKNTADDKKTRNDGAKWLTIVTRILILIIGLAIAIGAIVAAAEWLRGVILNAPLEGRGEWASLLGGGLGTWAFFLIRSGIIEQTFDLIPKIRGVWTSIYSTEWPPFRDHTFDLVRTMFLPGIVTVFALVFVGEQVREQIVNPPPSELLISA